MEKKRGHWRHAFLTIVQLYREIWVCRSCFKRLRAMGDWEIESPIQPARHG